ncbi:hypothetical protein C4J81_08290 [Deltaproteobacteria bacterium Smac51]|nr:hypothetical protein C4J81_08290 [Deltaproteobacteria bacterium Smac51]
MPDNRTIKIGGRLIGRGLSTLLVAEIGGNHGGDPELARRMVQAAAEAGADAVKFQAYRSAAFMSRRNPYYEELESEELSYEDLAALMAAAHDHGLAAGLTAFDDEGVELAVSARAEFIKIASGDITHHRLLEKAARTDKPIFISTGASTQAEVDAAMDTLDKAKGRLVVMQCASLYPAPLDSVDLAVMDRWLRSGVPAGYSDHTIGTTAARMAVTLGALVLEKHFTIDRDLPGGDNSISALPEDFRELADWKALRVIMWGDDTKRIQPGEMEMRPVIRRAVVAKRDLPAGWKLTENDVALMRPPRADGALGPNYLGHVVRRTLKNGVNEGELISLADLADA